MKKLFVFIFLIFLIGCEEEIERPIVQVRPPVDRTVSENIILSKPEILLEKIYDAPQTFKVADVIKGPEDLIVQVDGQVVEDAFTLDYGKHKIGVHYFVGEEESPHAYLNIEIAENIESLYTTLYEELDGPAGKILTSDIRSLDVYKRLIRIENDQIRTYYYLNDKGYFTAPEGQSYNPEITELNCKDNTFHVRGEITSDVVLVNGYYSIKSEHGDYLVDIETADFIELRNHQLSMSGRYMLTRQEDGFKLYEYKNGSYDLNYIYLKEANTYVNSYLIGDELRFSIEGDGSIRSLLGEDYLETYRYDVNASKPVRLVNKGDLPLELYKSYSISSPYLGKVDIDDLYTELGLVYTELSKKGMNEWLEVDKGYIQIDSDMYRYHGQLYADDGEKLPLDMWVYDELPNQDGYYLLGKNRGENYIYSVFTHEMQALEDPYVSNDGKVIIAYDTDLLTIYEFTSQGYQSVDSLEVDILKPLWISWRDDGFDIREDGEAAGYHLIYDKFTSFTNVNGHYVQKKLAHNDIAIYQEASLKSEQIGIVNFDLESVNFIRQYQVFDNKLMSWHEVEQAGLKGYVMLPMDPYMYRYEVNNDFVIKFVLNDGSIKEVPFDSYLHYSLSNEYNDFDYYVLQLEYEYGSTYLINKDSGSIHKVKGYVNLSPDKSSFMAIDYAWENQAYDVVFYDIEGDQIDENEAFTFYGWQRSRFEWVGEKQVNLVWDNYNNRETLGTFDYKDKKWQFTRR
ncbi:hypothetical protein EZV73_08220 [Acidaminobacter sp. JC074]|uniref:hypothetical protein n=1 Tax=Acidaminobacter sp. JC074 TaxID=2530199 RepID=UPI001F0FE82A|nr:hypothetical protein [Acidaminobacter sp. JC074]MCH4887554.1 hypothetical protein [Acidaminobacter sp. JC074]